MKARKRPRWKKLLWLPLWLAAFSVLQVLALRWIDPPTSSFMLIRQVEAWRGGEKDFELRQQWRDLAQISPALPISVVAAEDQKFPSHHGFDLAAMRAAQAGNARGGRIRGASTITQQVAKNLFLWSGGGYFRKGIEAWYALLIELLWPKQRILEVYLNIAEFGDGVYGAEAAAQAFFAKPASALSGAEAARLAAVLPNPRRWSAAKPGPYVQRRAAWIQRQVRQLGGPDYLQSEL